MTETPSLLAVTVAALQGRGRLVKTDWDIETFDVLPETGGAEPTLGVVMSSSRSVVFYAVWPDPIPDARRPAVAEYTVRANTDLYTSAFEFDLDSGILSIRAGVQFGALTASLPRESFAALLVAALEEVESAAEQHRPGVAAVLSGTAPRDALAAGR
jgi:hypothetical protein